MIRMPPLFDGNGSCGAPAGGTPDCPTLADRLAHMDRLGIDRSLVWNIEATQHHSLASNARLLEEMADTPGAEGRMVPALVVSGLIPYERDGVERLIGQMEKGRSSALRFVNVFGRLTLRQCEPAAPSTGATCMIKPILVCNTANRAFWGGQAEFLIGKLKNLRRFFAWRPVSLQYCRQYAHSAGWVSSQS